MSSKLTNIVGLRERERERVANYLKLPNNLMTFFAKKYSRYES